MKDFYLTVKTKRSGLRCKVNVPNFNGHDVLTTYDPEVNGSVEAAQKELVDFWNSCIDEFASTSRVSPNVFGQPVGEHDFKLVNPNDSDFDLAMYVEITFQPVPLSGG